jgi:nucleotide-binding universal stress UspA family protein
MIEIRRVLCPIDFSDSSRRALEHAIAIAGWYEAGLTALHVIHPVALPQPPILLADFTATSPTADRQWLAERLHDWLLPARRAGIPTRTVFDTGAPARSILAHAPGDGMIVMGTHGLSGFERFVLGSVAEKVLRKAICPVLTVPPPARTEAKVPYTRLLCPVDFSESSLAALRLALSLAEEADARLAILHVVDWPPDDDLLVERLIVPEFEPLVERDAHNRLESLVSDEARTWCRPETRMAFGKPYREILAAAERDGTDLIVMGIRGRNPVDLTLFGSTANQVVRRATCPVLTLRG